ncbi:MAG: lycopene cyclase family protein [Planctomycetota bacterium]
MPDPLLPAGGRVAIAGAGCAGLSLAVELAERRPDVSIDVFDRAPAPAADRTWCSWAVTPNRFDRIVSDRWTRVRVVGGTRDTTIDAAAYPYVCIQGRDFYDLVDATLAPNDRVTTHRGIAVQSTTESPRHAEVELAIPGGAAERRRYDLLFDARPAPPAPVEASGEPALIQHFGGVEIETPPGTVDPGTVTLMDFSVPQEQGAHFMYVLPYSRGTALVESTFLTPPGHAAIDYEAHALAYARERLGIAAPNIIYRESGALPMTLAALGPRATRRTWPIGTRAGIGRASSGYAFDAIQRDTVNILAAIAADRARPRPPRSPVLSLLDRVLISWLSSDQTAPPRVFGDLFAKLPPRSLIRFLADVPTPADLLRTMWAMPKLETTLHAVTHPSAWPKLAS